MIIGIGGISRSGKSFLSKELAAALFRKERKTKLVDQDDFVLPENEIPKIRDHINWEIPESIDWSKLMYEVKRLSKAADLVIVEGLLIYSHAELYSWFEHVIHIELDYETFVARKKADLRWGLEPDWYIQYIWDAHQQYGRPVGTPDLVLDGSKGFDIQAIIDSLEIC